MRLDVHKWNGITKQLKENARVRGERKSERRRLVACGSRDCLARGMIYATVRAGKKGGGLFCRFDGGPKVGHGEPAARLIKCRKVI